MKTPLKKLENQYKYNDFHTRVLSLPKFMSEFQEKLPIKKNKKYHSRRGWKPLFTKRNTVFQPFKETFDRVEPFPSKSIQFLQNSDFQK